MACDPDDDSDRGDYDDAVAALLSPLHQASSPDAIRAAAARRRRTLRDMRVYSRRVGLDLDGEGDDGASTHRVPPLIIHVAGTKGKGSTLAMCESILRSGHGLTTGTFSSPHLVDVRERIRIDGVPISSRDFGTVYWRVRRRLEQHRGNGEGAEGGPRRVFGSGSGEYDDDGGELPPLPGYFRMLTLMAMYAFCHYEPRIDAVLWEVGMGGRYDATNLFEPHPGNLERVLVRGVTLIDYDHTRVLGSTLERIAWEKGGIFVRDKLETIGPDYGGYDEFVSLTSDHKRENADESGGEVDGAELPETVFASGSNKREVLDVLRRIAKANGCSLEVVSDSDVEAHIDVGLQGEHQRGNAGLALAICHYAMKRFRKIRPSVGTSLPDGIEGGMDGRVRDALARGFWPGRCHTVSLPPATKNATEVSINLRCDGAHTPVSMEACVQWFKTVTAFGSSSPRTPSSYDTDGRTHLHRALMFNCSHEKKPIPMLYELNKSGIFTSAYFCKADFERPSAVPRRLEDEWMREPLGDGGATTLESICEELQTAKWDDEEVGGRMQQGLAGLAAPSWQGTLANLWHVLDAHRRRKDALARTVKTEIVSGTSVREGLEMIRNVATSENDNQVLVEVCITGSLYIVGSALKVAGWGEGEAPDGVG